MHPPLAVDHGVVALAHATAAAGVIGGLGVFAYEGVELLVALHLRARRDLPAAIRIHRRLSDDLAGQANGVAELLPVLLPGHVVEQDAGSGLGVARGEANAPAALGAHRAHVSLEAMGLHCALAVVADGDGQEVVLQVGPGLRVVGADEGARLELVAGADAAAEQQPLGADLRLVEPLQRRVESDRLLALVLDVHLQMVLQVLADPGQLVHHGDVELAQVRRIADARAQQDLRRGDGPGAQQHFAAGANLLCLAAAQVAHAHGALALELDHVRGGVGLDGEVVAPLGLVEIATRGGGAAPLGGDETVHGAEALLLVAVDVLGLGIARLHAGIDEGTVELVVALLGRGHVHRAIAAMIGIGAGIAALGLPEVGQAVGVAPVR